MATVPENQIITAAPKTIFNEQFASIAASLYPKLRLWNRLPQRLIKFQKDHSLYFGLRASALATPVEDLPTLLWGRKDEFVLDFGIHLVGRLSFRIEAEGINVDAPCRLHITFGESPFDVTEDMTHVETWISTSWLPDEMVNVDFMPEDVSLQRRYSFRYVRIRVVDTSPKFKVKFSKVVCEAVSAIGPDHMVDSFDYGDSLIQRIDEISIFTLRDCMQTVFEDGPRRDRRLWIGDLRLQALTNYCTFKDYDLVKRCLFMFAALAREDMTLPACLFEKPSLRPATDYIVDYDTLFGAIVYDYVIASGDLETGRLLWPTIQGSLLNAVSHLDPKTHVFDSTRVTAWKFLDWAEELDTSAGMHGVLLYSLKAVAGLGDLLDISPQPYTELISQLTSAAEFFLQKETGLLISGPRQQISLASAAWLVLSGAFSRSISRRALLNALSHPDSVKPLTPYLYHHVCDALASVGLYRECVELLKSHWGAMVLAGADTFWEAFNPDDARASPYGDVRNNSFCHAWSCTPSWLLRVRMADYLNAIKVEELTMNELDKRYVKRTCGMLVVSTV